MSISEEDDNFDIVNPRASNMIEALRDIGYSLESAVADIIDNSISADATRVDIRFGLADEGQEVPWLAIADNGSGMSEGELVEAMRPGGRDPLAKRKSDDLGRFGLGLKTASFSQCRKITVVSRKDGATSARQWDLDFVRTQDRWVLRRLSQEEIVALPGMPTLGESGTLVLWQQMDRLDLGNDLARFPQVLNERIMAVSEHVSLVFHRFISGEPGRAKIIIAINNAPIEAFDPFQAKHPATMHLGEEVLELDGDTVAFRPYILPHHSKVSSADYERIAGREGYLRGQGFYIYRNRRLIIHGTWFRMARQNELTKLARVQVDIPNTLDHLWTIDVKKSKAKPPEAVRRRLKGILERIRECAKRPYTVRGVSAVKAPSEAVWKRTHLNARVNYLPNLDHPLISELRADLPSEMRRKLDGFLSILGKALPFAMLFNDLAERPKETDTRNEDFETLSQLADLLFGEDESTSPEDIRAIMVMTEPFASSPKFIEKYFADAGRKSKNT